MDAHRDRERGIHARDLLEREEVRHGVESAATPFLGDQHAEKAESAERVDRLARELAPSVPLGDVGRELVRRELAGGAHDLPLDIRQFQEPVAHRKSPRANVARASVTRAPRTRRIRRRSSGPTARPRPSAGEADRGGIWDLRARPGGPRGSRDRRRAR